jgi:ribosomal protein L21
MNINTNQKNYSLKGTVVPKEISSAGRRYKVYLLKAEIKRRDKNNPYHRSKITMVVLRKDRNIPILIKVFASGALINAKLIEVK